jgi:ribonuclease HI
VIIKCSGACAANGRHRQVAAFGFTVRHDHHVVHKESGILSRLASACGEAAKQESVRRAVAWLLTQPVVPARVSIRCDGQDLAWEPVFAPLRTRGWAVEVERVCPELVSEAAALSRCTALAATRTRSLVAEAARAPAAARVAVRATPAVLPLRAALHSQLSGAAADAIIVCDGGYKPQPHGIATYACLVWAGLKLAHRESGVVCCGRAAGSHVAELAAAVAALRWLAASPLADGARVELRSDNQWVVNTLTSCLRRRPLPGTVMLLRAVDRLMSRLQRSGCQVTIGKVPRKLVAEADALCRQVYRERLARVGARTPRQPLKAFLRATSSEWQSRV